MKVAIPVKDGEIFPHFGKADAFRIYDIDKDAARVEGSVEMQPEASGHGYLADFLKAQGVNVVVCGGIGDRAVSALSEAGIETVPGVTGLADEAAKSLAQGTLEGGAGAVCDHKERREHEGGHCCH